MTKQTVNKILDRMSALFMEPEIVGPVDYWEVSANHGETHVIPCDVCYNACDLDSYVEGTIDEDENGNRMAERKSGYLARLSAPGYMDCTDWAAFATEDEAAEYLVDAYGDDIEVDEEE